MANLFQSNAYNILGLNTSVSQKDINKRAKEIITLLRVDEQRVYTDLKLAPVVRKESAIKDALEKLTSPTQRVREYFFWFDVESDVDENAMKHIDKLEYEEALILWREHGLKETAHGFIAKRNFAILSSLMLLHGGQKKYLTQSLGAWKDMVQSDRFWQHFEKVYALNDEVGTSRSTLVDFSKNVTDELSDFYTDVSQEKKDNSYYSLFSQVFGVKGKKIQTVVLEPIFAEIYEANDKLTNLNISEDNIISPEEVTTLRRLVKKLQNKFQELKDLGLYEDSQTKTARDKSSEAIRVVALDLFNNLNETKKPIALFNIALSLSGTIGTKNRIEKDIKDIHGFIATDKIVEPINALLEEEEYTEALELILQQRDKHKDSSVLSEYFTQRIQWCVASIAGESLTRSRELFGNGDYAQAAESFKNTRVFTEQYLDDYGINIEWINNNILQIENMLQDMDEGTIDRVSTFRDQIVEKSSTVFEGKFEHMIVVTLIDCAMYYGLAIKMPEIKRRNSAISRNNVATSILSRVVGWVVGFIIVAIIGGIFSAMGGSSSSSSAYNTCSTEYDSIKSQIDSIESRMSSYKSIDDSDGFNALVPEQNRLVAQGNAKAAECNGLR